FLLEGNGKRAGISAAGFYSVSDQDNYIADVFFVIRKILGRLFEGKRDESGTQGLDFFDLMLDSIVIRGTESDFQFGVFAVIVSFVPFVSISPQGEFNMGDVFQRVYEA